MGSRLTGVPAEVQVPKTGPDDKVWAIEIRRASERSEEEVERVLGLAYGDAYCRLRDASTTPGFVEGRILYQEGEHRE